MRRSTLGILVALVALVGVAAAALATPPSGVTSVPVGEGSFTQDPDASNLGVSFEADSADEVNVDNVTIEPGGTSGWHRHQGVVIVAVKSGELTRYNSNCTKTTYAAGTAFTEDSGVVLARNEGTAPLELVVTYLVPEGRARTLDRPNPGCAAE
jgi:quercetin dioxygenase-like cupin family protein